MNLNELVNSKLECEGTEDAEVFALSFELMDGFKNYNKVECCNVAYEEVGDNVCTLIEEQFINLMKQATYNYRYTDEVHYIMPIRDEDEYDAVEEFLTNYRKNKGEPSK